MLIWPLRSVGFRSGSRLVAIRLVFASERLILSIFEEDSHDTTILGPNSQTQADWKAITKDRLGVASRFAQTLLKKVPDCIDTNPVKVAFSIAKVIIEIKDVGCYLCILSIAWLLNQAVGGNKDELAQRLEDTAKRLLAVERTIVNGVPKAAEEAMENLKL